jgi:hypothetical protein
MTKNKRIEEIFDEESLSVVEIECLKKIMNLAKNALAADGNNSQSDIKALLEEITK